MNGEAMLRKKETAVGNGSTHPLAAFAYSRIGQTNERHVLQADGDVNLDMDDLGVQTNSGATVDFGKHSKSFCVVMK